MRSMRMRSRMCLMRRCLSSILLSVAAVRTRTGPTHAETGRHAQTARTPSRSTSQGEITAAEFQSRNESVSSAMMGTGEAVRWSGKLELTRSSSKHVRLDACSDQA